MRSAVLTGGAGFIGRWVAQVLLAEGWRVVVLDDLSGGSEDNLAEFASDRDLELVRGRVDNADSVAEAFAGRPELCVHLAAKINVQRSIDEPLETFAPDVLGTLNVLEASRAAGARFLFMSSCMVFAPAADRPLREDDPVRAASPYAASKLAGEHLTLSYGHAYGVPITVVRPFNTYGPFQRADGEGGVVAIFCRRALAGDPIDVFGDGTQTRDLLYVEDCAEFVVRAAVAEATRGELLNAGTGRDVSINELAELIGRGQSEVRHIPHPHPQAEIARLVCDRSRAERLLGWRSRVGLEEGIERVERWLAGRRE